MIMNGWHITLQTAHEARVGDIEPGIIRFGAAQVPVHGADHGEGLRARQVTLRQPAPQIAEIGFGSRPLKELGVDAN